MKILLAGAYGKLGKDILVELAKSDNEIIACDLQKREIIGLDTSKIKFHPIDVLNKETLEGICEGVDVVISTIGLTKKSSILTNYDVDYRGNLNILEQAKKSKVGKFIYISVIKADIEKKAPMVHAKYLFEQELKSSRIDYIILRPTGYMYDILKVFKPMVLKGKVTLLGKKNYSCNLIDTKDLAKFIINHLNESNRLYTLGGNETYTYEEIAKLCFKTINKKPKIKRAPILLFKILAALPKNKKNGVSAMLKFSLFTLTNDLVGDTIVKGVSFKEYVKENFKA